MDKICYVFDKDSKFFKWYKEKREMNRIMLNKVAEYISKEFGIEEKDVNWDSEYNVIVANYLLNEESLKNFIVLGSEEFVVRDKNGKYLGQYARLKRYKKQWKKVTEMYKENKFEKPRLDFRTCLFKWRYLGAFTYSRLEDAIYIIVNENLDNLGEWFEDAKKIKLSEYYKIIEERQKNEQ